MVFGLSKKEAGERNIRYEAEDECEAEGCCNGARFCGSGGSRCDAPGVV